MTITENDATTAESDAKIVLKQQSKTMPQQRKKMKKKAFLLPQKKKLLSLNAGKVSYIMPELLANEGKVFFLYKTPCVYNYKINSYYSLTP